MTKEWYQSAPAHIGVIVRDMNKAVAHYQSLGIGPFRPSKKLAVIDRRIKGKPIAADSIALEETIAKMGSVFLQLVRPVRGETLWKEFLENNGEGINHIGFDVEDIAKEMAEMQKRGYQLLYSSRFEVGGGGAYFDTGKVGGVLIELTQWPKGWWDPD